MPLASRTRSCQPASAVPADSGTCSWRPLPRAFPLYQHSFSTSTSSPLVTSQADTSKTHYFSARWMAYTATLSAPAESVTAESSPSIYHKPTVLSTLPYNLAAVFRVLNHALTTKAQLGCLQHRVFQDMVVHDPCRAIKLFLHTNLIPPTFCHFSQPPPLPSYVSVPRLGSFF